MNSYIKSKVKYWLRKQEKSRGLFWISLIMIILISSFLILWDVLNLAEKLQSENIFTISWIVRFSIILTVTLSLFGIIWVIIEIIMERRKKLLIRLIANLTALLSFVFIVIFYSKRADDMSIALLTEEQYISQRCRIILLSQRVSWLIKGLNIDCIEFSSSSLLKRKRASTSLTLSFLT
jgi:hypothetical protein